VRSTVSDKFRRLALVIALLGSVGTVIFDIQLALGRLPSGAYFHVLVPLGLATTVWWWWAYLHIHGNQKASADRDLEIS
jgi:hypothetical protein